MATNKEINNDAAFKKYIRDNKSTINKSALGDANSIKAAYDEWKSTGNLGKSYFLNNTTTTNKVEPIKKVDNTTVKVGQTSLGNQNIDKSLETVNTMKQENIKLANEKGDLIKASGQEQSDLIKKFQENANARYGKQQEQLDKNKETAYARSDERRKEADDILRRQEGIAARQANMSAAQAGASGLQLSAGAMQEITDDVIAKYGSNLSNAEQFRSQTNMTIDTALNNLDSSIFKDKQQVDSFLNGLDEKELAPLLTATQKATEGDVQALEDIRTYYNTLVQKKADEEMNRGLEIERIEDTQRQWESSDIRQKGAKLADDLKENSWIMDQYWANPDKFAKMSYSEALATLNKGVKNIVNLQDAGLVQYLTNKAAAQAEGKKFNTVPAYEQMLKDSGKTVEISDRTNEEKTKAMGNVRNTTSPLVGTPQASMRIKDTTKADLDKQIMDKGKDKTLAGLKTLLNKGSITSTMYDRMVNYINTK